MSTPFDNTPLVTIITPTYNRRELLSELIDSVRGQTLTSWELIIIDDGSTDETESYITSLQIPNVYFIKRSNITASKGPQVCRNIGIRLSKGKYLIFLDSDDVLFPTCLENRCSLMEKRPDLDFAVFWAVRFQGNVNKEGLSIWGGKASFRSELDDFLNHNILWQTSGPIWRRSSIIEKQGYWDEKLTFAGHDYEYHVRALCKGLAHVNAEQVDYGWRMPSKLSLSSHNSFKTGYLNGSFIQAFDATVKLLEQYKLITDARKPIIRKEAIRLAVQTRLNGGNFDMVRKDLLIARRVGALSQFQFAELILVFKLWFKIFNRVFSMSYLSRRYPDHR